MITAEIIRTGERQSVQLPKGFEFDAAEVAVRRSGDAVVLEPIKPARWPDRFFERIRIDDQAFQRPPQGSTPAAPDFNRR